MENPELVVDVYSRIWQYDTWIGKYKCLSNESLPNQSVTELIAKCSPINALVEGEVVKQPFKPIAEGTWIEFDRNILVHRVSGQVHSYDSDKLFYRVIINVPRDEVNQSL